MANWHLEFYRDDTGYSDGDIELEMLDIVKNHTDYNTVLSKDDRWPMFYHLSELRHNVFSWYPFNKEASLLEIGSGCGALTGLFCEKVDHVTSVELTKIRSEINYERNKEYDNLDLYTGNFNAMTFPEKFDYIILNGVLEYAASFTEGDSPYESFLSTIRSLLKKDGILLIAIENRLGLKYFNGAVEDHTAALFSGLNDYSGIDFVRTFSKKEMNDLLDASSFGERRFYYPYPDYKFPTAVFTDATINTMDFSYPTTNAGYDHDRLTLFDENKMLKTLKYEGIRDHFANSFIIEVKKSGTLTDSGIDYVKFSNNRRKNFNIATLIRREKGKRVVDKLAMSPGAEDHLKRMLAYYESHKNDSDTFQNAPLTEIENGIRMIYFEFHTLEQELCDLIRRGEKKAFESQIQGVIDWLWEDAEIYSFAENPMFQKVFGTPTDLPATPCLKNTNIDYIFSNIMVDSIRNRYYIIDYEWVFDFAVPVKFLIWRCLFYFYINNNESSNWYTMEDFMMLGDITVTESVEFEVWEHHFGEVYVAGNPASHRYIKNTYDETPSLNRFLSDFDSTSEIYYGVNFAFIPETVVRVPFKLKNDCFEITVDVVLLRQTIPDFNTLRIDPVNKACEISEIQIVTETGEHLDYSTNAYRESDGVYLFGNDDPQIIIDNIPKTTETITFSGVIKKISLNRQIDTLISIEVDDKDKIFKVKRERETYKGKYLRTYEQLYHIQNSVPYKMAKPLLKARHKLKRK